VTPELADALAAVECGVPMFAPDRAWDDLGVEEQALCHVVRAIRQRERADLSGLGVMKRKRA